LRRMLPARRDAAAVLGERAETVGGRDADGVHHRPVDRLVEGAG
jgi:hypothetical protein